MIKNNKGVTIVELLLVVVLMGIIAAFAIPAINNTLGDTRKKSVLNDAQALASAARNWCANNTSNSEYDDYCTADATLIFQNFSGKITANTQSFDTLLIDYVDGIDINNSDYQVAYEGGAWKVYYDDLTYSIGAVGIGRIDISNATIGDVGTTTYTTP